MDTLLGRVQCFGIRNAVDWSARHRNGESVGWTKRPLTLFARIVCSAREPAITPTNIRISHLRSPNVPFESIVTWFELQYREMRLPRKRLYLHRYGCSNYRAMQQFELLHLNCYVSDADVRLLHHRMCQSWTAGKTQRMSE